MVFYTDCARDIVRIINHRRQLLLDIPLDNGKFVCMYICMYACMYTYIVNT